MTDKHDKLVGMARECGFSLVTNEGYQPTPAQLAAIHDRIVASLCADVEPVAWRFRWNPQGDWHITSHEPQGGDGTDKEPLYPASTVASLTAQRDAALARVAELEKDAQDRLDTVQAIFDAIGYTKEYAMQWPKEKASVTFKRWFDEQMRAALTKGQPAQHPQQEQPTRHPGCTAGTDEECTVRRCGDVCTERKQEQPK